MLHSQKKRRLKKRSSLTPNRLSLESLEDRRLMAVDISLTDGLLHIEGDGADDIVKISHVAPVQQAYRGFLPVPRLNMPMINVWHGHREGGQTVFDGSSSFLSFFVNGISFNGNNGNDLFDNQTMIQSEAHGGFGFDVLKGGSNHDKLFGEGDQDYLYGNAGNDYLVGGGGFDRISGGEGNDTLRGSGDWNGTFYNDNMHDYLMGGNGYDTVVDEVLEDAELTPSYLKLASFTGNVVEYNMLNSIESIKLIGNGLDNTIDASKYSGGKLFVDAGSGHDVLIGSDGNDILVAGAGNDMVLGNGGHDFIIGGDGNDSLAGHAGNDVIVGGQGNDDIYGNEGNDFLLGNEDDDTLHGGQGKDSLFGGKGDDNLYGGAENDSLFGNAGDDGLFGGGGADSLTGGADEDRFLFQAGDTIVDKNAKDAQIDFVDLASWSVTYNGSTINYTGGAWTDNEVELIDQALAVLHHTTGDTTFLKEKDGTEMTYQRVGTSSSNFIAWNGGDVHTFADGTFTGSNDGVLQIVFHEIGHNWDSENAKWDDWKKLSSWTQDDKSADANFIAGGNGGWFYSSGADFVRNYAKTNPKEDFACSFSAYFMDQLGKPFGGGGAANAADKMNFMDAFVVSKS